jgi:murein DD-endopeptidase MepM/ murein hydrolase activator NlpD
MEEGGKKKLYKKLRNKYRLVILNDSTFEEKISLRLSPLNLFTIIGSFTLILILTVSVIIVFTPIREYIPGYTDVDLRQDVLKLTLRSDSVERELELKQKYLINLKQILSGQPMENELSDFVDTGRDYNNITIVKTPEDSVLRAYVEGEDQFNLVASPSSVKQKVGIRNFAFFSPLSGSVTSEFNLDENHFGIDIVAPENEAIKSCLDGTVIFAEWTVETGYVIQVQHKNNLISVYKHNAVLLKKTGDYVNAGETIAIIGNSGELTTGPHLHFELWFNGNPIDPREYMVF